MCSEYSPGQSPFVGAPQLPWSQPSRDLFLFLYPALYTSALPVYRVGMILTRARYVAGISERSAALGTGLRVWTGACSEENHQRRSENISAQWNSQELHI